MMAATASAAGMAEHVSTLPTLLLIDEAQACLGRMIEASKALMRSAPGSSLLFDMAVDEQHQEVLAAPLLAPLQSVKEHRSDYYDGAWRLSDILEELQRRSSAPPADDTDVASLRAHRDSLQRSVDVKRDLVGMLRERLRTLQLHVISATADPIAPPIGVTSAPARQ